MYNLYKLLWICFISCAHCEVCSVTNINSPVSKDCQYGCCTSDNGDTVCCGKPFWTWGVVVGIVIAAIVGVIVIIFTILMCIYCKKKKTHTSRLRHTVSMRSNRIRPFPDLPSYEDIETNTYYIQGAPPQYDVPPPKYEEVVSDVRTSNMPQIQPSARRPVMSKTITRNRP